MSNKRRNRFGTACSAFTVSWSRMKCTGTTWLALGSLVWRDTATDRLFRFLFVQVFRKIPPHAVCAVPFELNNSSVFLRQVIRQGMIPIRLHRPRSSKIQPGVVNLSNKTSVRVGLGARTSEEIVCVCPNVDVGENLVRPYGGNFGLVRTFKSKPERGLNITYFGRHFLPCFSILYEWNSSSSTLRLTRGRYVLG